MKVKIGMVTFLSLLAPAGTAIADHHEDASTAEMLEEMTYEHNRTASRGGWEAHFFMYAAGCAGFYEAGMKRTNMKTQEAIDNRIRNRKTWNENGGRQGIFARQPETVVYGDIAVVTCYQHGWYENTEGERTNVFNRVSLVWKKWKTDGRSSTSTIRN